MKIFYAFFLIGLVLAANCIAQNGGKRQPAKNTSVIYQQFDGYFENNNSGLSGDKSFLIIDDQEQFDKIFGAARTMKDQNFLPPDVFKTKSVAAVIKRGGLRKYDNVKVTTEKGNLIVSYETEDAKQDSATYSSPLIIAFDRGNYKKIYFRENGKSAGSISKGK